MENTPKLSGRKFTMRLMDTRTKACDGSTIRREVWEAYLASPEFKTALDKHLISGGITHLNRHLQSSEDGVGPDDGVLVNNNITHIITKVYFKDATDPCVYADAEVLDPDNFSGDQKDKIKNLEGMLKAGMFLPISIVISADWNPREEATHIENLLGADITLNPSFKGAGIIKIFSDTGNKRVRTFNDAGSIGEAEPDTRFFSYETDTTYKLLLYKKPLYYQFFMMFQGYKRYFSTHQSVDPNDFKQIVIQDFTHILTRVEPYIRNKRNLNTLLVLQGYSEHLRNAMKLYADTHYMTLINREANGYILKGRFEREMFALRNLYDAVIKEITNGKMSIDSNDKGLQLI